MALFEWLNIIDSHFESVACESVVNDLFPSVSIQKVRSEADEMH